MIWRLVRRSLLVAVVFACPGARPVAAQTLESIAANDNRRPAGVLHDGILTLRLELRKGIWHPEREDGEGFPVYAFGEAGKPLQDPGPLVRVTQGTVIELTIHSQLTVPATLHGLHQRPGKDSDVVTVAAGATQTVRFMAGAPGTYSYWGRTPDGQRGNARVVDSQLGGALVIDRAGPVAEDRIFVLERWNAATRTAINGKSWPYTERLTYKVGETVRWRIVNASDLSHPMHLHGSHFTVDAAGDDEHYETYAPGSRPLMFTRSAEIGDTFEMSWVPREPGRWLYHCHRIPHMRIPISVDPADVTKFDDHHNAHHDPEYAGMGGMIIGITITGPHEETAADRWKGARKLELAVGERNGDPRFFDLALRESEGTPATSRGRLTGPPIVLERDKPVEIAVVNRLKEATAVHWHGIELESYYDGVPGWGGIGQKKTPAVEPGRTFVARMVPSRAGTFIYHTHWHDNAQLTGGIHGPLIVMPPGQTYDPETDKAFLFSQSPTDPFVAALLLMNGVPQPQTLRLKTGTKYRFRFINMTPSVANLRVSLRQASMPVSWRAIAKDAVDLPGGASQRAELQVSVGETYDFEYEATAPQELTLEGVQPNDTQRAVQTLIFSEQGK